LSLVKYMWPYNYIINIPINMTPLNNHNFASKEAFLSPLFEKKTY
jgi:hypothetical protein